MVARRLSDDILDIGEMHSDLYSFVGIQVDGRLVQVQPAYDERSVCRDYPNCPDCFAPCDFHLANPRAELGLFYVRYDVAGSTSEVTHDDGGILAAEAKARGDGDLDGHFAGGVGDVIEVADWIALRLIDG